LSDLGIANHDEITVDSSGRMTNSSQPAFAASCASSGGSKAPATVPYASTDTDGFNLNTGNHYSTSTYRFTAPVNGVYYFAFNIYTDTTNPANIEFRVNGSSKGAGIQDRTDRTGSNTYVSLTVSHIIPLSTGDFVEVYSGERFYVDSNTWFSGVLIG